MRRQARGQQGWQRQQASTPCYRIDEARNERDKQQGADDQRISGKLNKWHCITPKRRGGENSQA